MSKRLMVASAAWMAACGLALTFAPQEVLRALGGAPEAGLLPPGSLLLVQLLGALYLGGALTNWMSKGSLVGGVFGRPLAVGNLAHFGMGAVAAVRVAAGAAAPIWPLVLALVYTVLALGFYWVTFGRQREASCN